MRVTTPAFLYADLNQLPTKYMIYSDEQIFVENVIHYQAAEYEKGKKKVNKDFFKYFRGVIVGADAIPVDFLGTFAFLIVGDPWMPISKSAVYRMFDNSQDLAKEIEDLVRKNCASIAEIDVFYGVSASLEGLFTTNCAGRFKKIVKIVEAVRKAAPRLTASLNDR